jgi:hypothetical protein
MAQRFKPFEQLSNLSQHKRAAELFYEIDQVFGDSNGKTLREIIAGLDQSRLSPKAQDTLRALTPRWAAWGWI